MNMQTVMHVFTIFGVEVIGYFIDTVIKFRANREKIIRGTRYIQRCGDL